MTGPTADDATRRPHVDADALADLHAGLLGDERAAVQAHIEHCPQCARRLAEIASVPGLLAAMPDQRMPDAVQQRLAAAIREQADGAPLPRDQLAARRARRPRAWASPGAGVAAAALVVLVGVVVALGVILPGGGGGSGTKGARAGAGSAADSATVLAGVAVTATGNAYTGGNLERLVPPLVTGTPEPALAPRDASAPAPAADYLSEEQATATAPTAPSPGVGTVEELRQRLGACARELEPSPGQQPLAVDIGTYDKQPAAVFVYPAPTGGGYYVYVVKATDACPGGVFTLWHHVRPTG